MKNKPSGLLADAGRSGYFVARYSVLRVYERPQSNEPDIESERRVFKYRVLLERELLAALPRIAAEQAGPCRDPAYAVPAALRAARLPVRVLELVQVIVT